MLVSHRHHAPPLGGAQIELDRVIGEHAVFRRVQMAGVVHDDRLMCAPAPAERARLMVLLAGTCLVFAEGQAWELRPGAAVVVDHIDRLRTCGGPTTTLEIDWDPGAAIGDLPRAHAESIRIGAPAFAALESLAEALARARADQRPLVEHAAHTALSALSAEGLPLRAALLAEALGASDDADQRLWTAIDRALCRLDRSPDAEDLVAELGWSRRTLTRRLGRLDQRYRVHGPGGAEWRSQRDFYRLLVGSIFSSHPDATTSSVARMVGYRSAEALCHAFANAGLPSPASVRRAIARRL